LAICGKPYFKLKGQSAGNLYHLFGKGILRDYTPKLCKRNYTEKIEHPTNVDLGYYLAGLIEGDGCIVIPKNKNNPSIEISFYKEDFPLASLILSKIGKGSLLKIKKANGYCLSFKSVESLLKIIELINGKIRTPKYIQFQKLLIFLNAKYNYNLILLPLDNSSYLDNYWLSGFIDADGSFYVRNSENVKVPRIDAQFYLELAEKDLNGNDTFPFLSNITKYLALSEPKFIDRLGKGKSIRIRSNNIEENLRILKYIERFPLFTSKYLNYVDWKEVVYLIKNKQHNLPENRLHIANIKKRMNSFRTLYNWEHLSNFPNLT
jgi:hypothetical protein